MYPPCVSRKAPDVSFCEKQELNITPKLAKMNKIGDLDVIKEDKNIALYTKMIKRGLLRDHYFFQN